MSKSLIGFRHLVRISLLLDRVAAIVRRVENLEELWMDRRLASGDLHDVRLTFVRHHGIEHALDVLERAMCLPLRAAAGVADRTAQIARVGNLDERKTAVLLVIGTEAAVVRTAVVDWCVSPERHLRRLEIHLTALAVIVDVVRNQNAFGAVRRTMLEHPHAPVLKHNLAVDLAVTRRADRHDRVIVKVWPRCGWHHSLAG